MNPMLAQSSPNLVQHLIQPSTSLPLQQPPMNNVNNINTMSNMNNMSVSPAVSITPVSAPNYTDNISQPQNATSVMNANQSGLLNIILPQQNQNTPAIPSAPQNIPTNLFAEPMPVLNNPLETEDANDSALRQLLQKSELTCKRESGTPLSSSSDSLPSLDSLLNTSSLQNVTVTTNETEKTSTLSAPESICEVMRNADSNSSHSELSSAFQKSCRTTEDRCAVCKETKNLINCTSCSKSYHADCHVPSLASVKIHNDWVCMLCRDVLTFPVPEEDAKRKLIDLQGRELMTCERILLEVFVHPKSFHFHNKVSKKVPNYYKVIKRPMDLSTIRMKLSPAHFEHYVDVEGFCDDMRLVFQNCFIFNTQGSDVYNDGKEVQAFFDKLLQQYFPELELDEQAEDDEED